MSKTGIKLTTQIGAIASIKPEIYNDISKLKTGTIGFNQFKQTYTELFDGTYRSFSKKSSLLGGIRRAYNQARNSTSSVEQVLGTRLENSYKGITIQQPTPPTPPSQPTGASPITDRVRTIITPVGFNHEDKGRYRVVSQVNLTINSLRYAMNHLTFSNSQIQFLRSKGYNTMRIFVEFTTTSNSVQIISSEVRDITEIAALRAFLNFYQVGQIIDPTIVANQVYGFINDDSTLTYEVVNQINAVFIRFYQD